MTLTMRPYQNEDDYWHIREFLRRVFRLNAGRSHSWEVARFDYWRWHGNANIDHDPLDQVIFIWESSNGDIAAVLVPEGKGEAHFQTHPDHRSLELEEELLAAAEQHLAVPGKNGGKKLCIWSHAYDDLRCTLLQNRGYSKNGTAEFQRHRLVELPVPETQLPPGYSVRSLGDGAELLERCYASGLAFHPNDIRYAIENRENVTWYRNIQNAPLYRRDLDIVAIAPDGAVASFCTVWLDDWNRTGGFEPVGTVPTQQGRGLGKAVMSEGLRRLQRMGAKMAYVGSYSPKAHALYHSVGFIEYDLLEPWLKEF